MSYKITYYPKPKKSKLPAIVCTGIMLFSLFLYREKIQQFLLPPVSAVMTLVTSLQEGTSLSDAVHTFCQDWVADEN